MELDYKNFSGNRLPKEIFEMLELVDSLYDPLKEILFHELDQGNKISGVDMGFPSEDSIIVQLTETFGKKYIIEGVEFKELNDPHYWMLEYSFGDPVHLVVSGK